MLLAVSELTMFAGTSICRTRFCLEPHTGSIDNPLRLQHSYFMGGAGSWVSGVIVSLSWTRLE